MAHWNIPCGNPDGTTMSMGIIDGQRIKDKIKYVLGQLSYAFSDLNSSKADYINYTLKDTIDNIENWNHLYEDWIYKGEGGEELGISDDVEQYLEQKYRYSEPREALTQFLQDSLVRFKRIMVGLERIKEYYEINDPESYELFFESKIDNVEEKVRQVLCEIHDALTVELSVSSEDIPQVERFPIREDPEERQREKMDLMSWTIYRELLRQMFFNIVALQNFQDKSFE